MRRTKSSRDRDRDRDRDLWCETHFERLPFTSNTNDLFSNRLETFCLSCSKNTRNVNKTRLAFAEHFTTQILGIPGLIKCILM